MAARRQPKKKHSKSKRTASGKLRPKKSASKKLSAKRKTPAKKLMKKKGAKKRSTARKLSGARTSEVRTSRAGSGRQAGDLQGLSRVARANSESVDELIEEGNPFEAEAVMGVENAENADEQEVRTHEVLEDDVPGEYLDKD